MALSFLRKQTVKSTKSPRQTWLEVAGGNIPVVITENARSRRLTLRIVPGGKEMRVTAPPRTPFREIDAFLYKHRGWVAARLSSLPEVQTIEAGATITLRGVPHVIIHAGRGRGLVKAVEEDGEYQLHVYGDIHHLQRRLLDFLKNEARRDLAKAVHHHAANLGATVKSITLRDTKTRWGSCSSSGALSFSWRVILAPPDVLDYLAAHEVAHLREMNHSPRFWKLVAETCPHARTSKTWLKRNGASLHALVIQGKTP